MICNIADLQVMVPATGDLVPRCQPYLAKAQEKNAAIIIKEVDFRPSVWPGLSPDAMMYMESGIQFYAQILRYNGLMLHASAVELNGKAYLFSGDCGAGKSTHTRLWQSTFGESARVFNDDKPALRYVDGTWYAYGTPWCGKDGININMKAPLAGICFLKQAKENRIRRLTPKESAVRLLAQTLFRFTDIENTLLMTEHADRLLRDIPIFELENRPEPEAARLSYETMRRAAEEAGL